MMTSKLNNTDGGSEMSVAPKMMMTPKMTPI